MTVIDEALKRAEQPKQKPVKQAYPPGSPRSLSRAWAVAAFAVFVAIASLYVREIQSRQKTQAKLLAALLKLNDAREDAKQAREERARALADKDAIAAKDRQVEYDNIEKEKKISDLSREVHELKMKGPPQPAQAQ